MLNNIKSLALNYDFCIDGKTLDMFKKAGFDGIDFGFSKEYFEDGKWEERTYRVRKIFKFVGNGYTYCQGISRKAFHQ